MSKMNSALAFHQKLNGKIKILSKTNLSKRENLILAYTPGVAQAVNYIAIHKKAVFDLTIKKNAIAVITDGSAVLGLGNVGAEAALPVMEGKCAIFSEFAHINAFPICLQTQKTEEIISIIRNISPVFGGINLEDISAPRCFEIEEKLQDLGIPVMHDDQHATAIVVLAGLYNAVKIVNKKLKKCKIVIVGSGAAGTAITKLLVYLKINNILVVDTKGIISSKRFDLSPHKKELSQITNKNIIDGNLSNACQNADILIGVSSKNIFTKEIINSMNKNPIIFALANPDPEINQDMAKQLKIAVYANGRSDCPNQINNALVFPGFFKGLLQKRITKITNEMKVNSAQALARLIKKPSPEKFMPSIFDRKVVPTIVASLS